MGATPADTFALSGNHTFSLSFTGDSRRLATTSESGYAEFWNIEQPEPIATRLLRPDGTPVVASALATYPDRSGLIIADSSKGILEISADSSTKVVLPMDPQKSSGVNGAALITNHLLAVRSSRTISLWDLDRKAPSGTLRPSHGNESFYGPLAASKNYLVTASSSGRDDPAHFIGATEWRLSNQPIPRRVLAPNGWGFSRFAVSPTRDRLFTGTTYRGVVSSLDLADGTPSLNRLFTFDVEVTDIAVTEDGRYLYTAHFNGDVLRTSLADGGKTEVFLSGTAGKEPRLALSSDGSLLAIGNQDGDVSLWSTATHERDGPLLRYSDTPKDSLAQFDSSQSVEQLAFLDGQNRLIVSYSKGVLVAWDLRIDQWVKHALRMAGRSLTDDERHRFLGDAAIKPRHDSKQPINAENTNHPKDAQERCYQGFIEQSFEPLGCSDSLRSLVDQIVKSRPSDSVVCSAYAHILTRTPILLSGIQREWARGEISNKTMLTPAAISILALTGESSEAGFLQESIDRDSATPAEFALSEWAQAFLERFGRETSLERMRSVSDPGGIPYQQFLAWPKCDEPLVPWQTIDPIRSGRGWPDLKVEKLDIHNASAIAYKLLAPGKERYTMISSIGELLADEKAPEARNFGTAALRLAPRDPQTHNVAGLIEERLGNLDAAAAHYSESAALGPHDGWPVFNLAQLSDRRGDINTAEREFQEALTRSNFSDGHNDRAEFLNGYAWFLYTHRSSNTPSMRSALSMAQESNKLGGFQDYGHLDTLAAINFTLEEFVDAVYFERKAVSLLGRHGNADPEIKERLDKFEQRLRAGVELPPDVLNDGTSGAVDVNAAERACKGSIRVYQARIDGTYSWLSDDDMQNFSHYYSSKQDCVASLPHTKMSTHVRLSWQPEGAGHQSGIACSCVTQ